MRGFLFYLRIAVSGSAGVVLLHTTCAYSLMQGCRATPALTIGVAAGLSEVPRWSEGYRLEAVRWDPLLQQRWAIVTFCGRPGLPKLMLPMQKAAIGPGLEHDSSPTALFPVVHAGDVVRILRQEEFLRIELSGIAEENGVLGERVRIHLLRPAMPGSSPVEAGFDGGSGSMLAVIRGPHIVEIGQ
jgi:hypothetical protein